MFEATLTYNNTSISIITNSTPSGKGLQKGFLTLFTKEMYRDMLQFHCIMHQGVLCTETDPKEILTIIDLVAQKPK